MEWQCGDALNTLFWEFSYQYLDFLFVWLVWFLVFLFLVSLIWIGMAFCGSKAHEAIPRMGVVYAYDSSTLSVLGEFRRAC